MRGSDVRTEALFAYVSCERRVPKDHPLRGVLPLVDSALSALSPAFAKLYASIGRPSIPPEKLLRALLLQAFYSVRSERQLMERLEFDLLFRWFPRVGPEAARGQAPGSGSMSRCGIIRASLRTATGCWMATSPPSFWPRCWPSRG